MMSLFSLSCDVVFLRYVLILFSGKNVISGTTVYTGSVENIAKSLYTFG
jgi:hypothetical protein